MSVSVCVCVHLQSWVDGEAAGCGVHAGHVLNVVYFLQKQLITVIPGSTHTHTSMQKKKSLFNSLACTHALVQTQTPTHTRLPHTLNETDASAPT